MDPSTLIAIWYGIILLLWSWPNRNNKKKKKLTFFCKLFVFVGNWSPGPSFKVFKASSKFGCKSHWDSFDGIWSVFQKRFVQQHNMMRIIYICINNPASFIEITCNNNIDIAVIPTGKLLLMLQSIKRALRIDPDNPKLHECIVKFSRKGKKSWNRHYVVPHSE